MMDTDNGEQSPLNIVFYPLSYESAILNGIGVINGHLTLSELLSMIEFSYIKFINEEIFFFQKKFSKGQQPCDYNEQLVNNDGGREPVEFYIYPNLKIKNLNILKHMVLKSKKLKENEKRCLILAIDFGFPFKSIVDFETKKLDNRFLLHKLKEMTDVKRRAGIEEDFSYFNDQSKEVVLKALEINRWWKNSFKLYLRAREIQKKKDWEKTMGKNKTTKMNEKLRRKYYQLRSRRNINDFNRVMGDFYKSLLLETQKECKDFTKRVLGYAF
jgi:hypothetical protein